MNEALEFAAVLPFAAAPLAAVLTGYAVFRSHRRADGARPVWRGVGVAVGLLVAAPAAFLLVGRVLVGGGLAGGSLAGGPGSGPLALGPLALLGAGVYLLARRRCSSERERR